MNSVLVFTGRAAVDAVDFRWQLLRVPEVSNVLKEAQIIIDGCLDNSKDLVSFIQRENNEYLAGGLWRELCSQLVQIGLYRRFEKHYSQPRFIIGDAGNLSAAQVCLGTATIKELIAAFMAELAKKEEEELSRDFLVGQKLEMSKVFENTDGVFSLVSEGKSSVGLLEVITKDHILDQVITLGAASSLTGFVEMLPEVAVVESVMMDPLLSWMIPYVRSA